VQPAPHEQARQDVTGRGNALPGGPSDTNNEVYIPHKRERYLVLPPDAMIVPQA
jgi:hypothetical protein